MRLVRMGLVLGLVVTAVIVALVLTADPAAAGALLLG